MECREIQELLTAYICNELAPEEKHAIQAHLKQCADCRREEFKLRKTWEMAGNWKAKGPSEQTVKNLYDKIKSLPQSKKMTQPRFYPALRVACGFAAAAAVLIAILIFFQTKMPPQLIIAGEPEVKKGEFTITVYNDNLAMIKDSSIITNLKNGLNIVRFHGVTSGIKPDSVSFKSLTDPSTTQVFGTEL